jgi:hypothetical protein
MLHQKHHSSHQLTEHDKEEQSFVLCRTYINRSVEMYNPSCRNMVCLCIHATLDGFGLGIPGEIVFRFGSIWQIDQRKEFRHSYLTEQTIRQNDIGIPVT